MSNVSKLNKREGIGCGIYCTQQSLHLNGNARNDNLFQSFFSTPQSDAIYHVFKNEDGNVPVAKFIAVSDNSLVPFINFQTDFLSCTV